MPKLYANAVYMVLNSRFQIIGGRDTYLCSTDMSITTTMIRDLTSQLAVVTYPADGMQGRAPVIAISNEVFNDNSEKGQMNVSHDSLRALLELITPKDKPQDSCISHPA